MVIQLYWNKRVILVQMLGHVCGFSISVLYLNSEHFVNLYVVVQSTIGLVCSMMSYRFIFVTEILCTFYHTEVGNVSWSCGLKIKPCSASVVAGCDEYQSTLSLFYNTKGFLFYQTWDPFLDYLYLGITASGRVRVGLMDLAWQKKGEP